MKKKFLLLSMICLIILTGCSMKASIPDIKNKSVDDAKKALDEAGIKYVIEYEVDPDVATGKVIRTDPKIGTKVDNKTEVTVYVSGKEDKISTQGSRIQWTNISSSGDNWEYYAPNIKDNTLTIRCDVVEFGANVEWVGDKITGIVSEYKDLSNPIKISFPYEKKSVSAGESQEINIIVPLDSFEGRKPTTLYFAFKALVDGQETDININLRMVW